jgi:hypothetical protein
LTGDTSASATDSSSGAPLSINAVRLPATMVHAIRTPPRYTTTTPIPIAGQNADASLFVEIDPIQLPSDAAQYATAAAAAHRGGTRRSSRAR